MLDDEKQSTLPPGIYIAGPLFSEAERTFNLAVRDILAAKFDTFLPQTDGGLLTEMITKGLSVIDAGKAIFEIDLAAIRRCDHFIVILDGRTIDEGAAFELGYAFSLNKICIGLQTDSRRMFCHGNNPMIERALIKVFGSIDQLKHWLLEGNLL